MKAPQHFPTRDEIARFIADERAAGREVGRREIAKAFGFGAGERIHLKRLMKELEADEARSTAAPVQSRKADGLPAVLAIDVTGRDRDGELVGMPADWSDDQTPAPRITLIAPVHARRGGHVPVPGVGDRILGKLMPRAEGYEAKILKILVKTKPAIIGVFRADKHGGGRVVPVEKRSAGRELAVRPGDESGAQDGDLVTVSVVGSKGFGLSRARVKERLGSLRSEKAVSQIAIHTHGIPSEFSPATLREAEAARSATLEGREDWRMVQLVTIDPADAKDHDDAVHAAPDDDPKNPGGHVLTVAIADVAAYVQPGSAMDREALERGNSVYFPDRVVPMLPERISNDLCSLKPLVDRPAIAVRIVIGVDGRKIRHSFHRVLMRSVAKLAYPQAQAAIDGRADDLTAPLLEPVLKPLWAAYAVLKLAREQRQPLDLDLPERKLVLDAEGRVLRVMIPERLDAMRLIEEFMILANVCAAETLERAHSGLIYRVHDEPSLEKMRGLGEVLASIGQKLSKQGALQPALFNRILSNLKGSEHETFVNEIVLRSQAQAVYARENLGHFGLNLRKYAHFTSPIRRYADLVVHRALLTQCKLGDEGLCPDTPPRTLDDIAERISNAERRAMAAERETIDRLIAYFLADRIGATFDGRISGVTKAGLFVKLNETGADGFVPAATLGADYFVFDEREHALTGSRTGESFRLGDQVSVKLVEVAPVAGAIRFEIVSEGRRAKPLPSGRGRSRSAKRAPSRAGFRPGRASRGR